MNMRWAWTLPVLSLATMVAGPAWAQDGSATAAGGAPTAMTAGQPTGEQYAVQAAMYQQAAMQAAMYQQAMYQQALYQQAQYQQAAMYPQGVQPAAYMGGPMPQMPGPLPGGAIPDVNGAYGYAPSDFSGPAAGPMQGYGLPDAYSPQGMNDPQGYGDLGMGAGCPYCGGQGCQHCGGGGMLGHHGNGSFLPNGLLGDVVGLVAPYPDGGCAAVRWFDFAVDYMALRRDNVGRGNQAFTSLGVGGPIVLSADDLDFGSHRPGFRFTGAFQVGPGNSLEFTYFGQFNYNASARAVSPGGRLFSVFSQFGVQPPLVGFAEFDQANFNQIDYQSSFDSFEVNWRNRWMSPNCRYQGSWTAGVRHFILDEKFRYATSSQINSLPSPTGPVPGQSRTDTDVTNNLTGIQLGTDMWICVLPGLRVGGELQAGVYGNHMNINTTAGSNQVATIFRENLQTNDVSFIGQVNMLATYRINYQWTLRGGYQFLFVDGVALALENFNPQPPVVNNPFAPRVPVINDNGDVFYHGWNLGLEFMW